MRTPHRHIVTIKLVRNQRKNFVNFRVRKELVPTIHVHTDAPTGITVLFALSIYLEPCVTSLNVVCQQCMRHWVLAVRIRTHRLLPTPAHARDSYTLFIAHALDAHAIIRTHPARC
jgi:hypothetical protein